MVDLDLRFMVDIWWVDIPADSFSTFFCEYGFSKNIRSLPEFPLISEKNANSIEFQMTYYDII